MANTVKIKRSGVENKIPTLDDLSLGELGLNTFHGRLYTRKDNGTASIVEIGAGSSGISSLNSQTGATQTFAVGTSGSDVAFSSSSDTHTLNLPSASTTARGAVTTAAQTFGGTKTFSDGTVALATTTTSVPIISRGAASQTGNLLEAQNNSGTVLAAVNSAGSLILNQNKRCGAPTTGTNSVALGRNALNASAAGADANTCVGDYAGSGITSGYRSTCIGYGANGGTTGYGNTTVGYNAGGSITGSFENTYLGQNAGDTSTGSRNVFVGYYAGISGATVGAGRVTVVGYAAKAQGDYALAIGENASAAANSCVVRWGNANRISGDSNGQVGVNEATPGGQLQVTTGAAARKALLIKGAASQSANLLEVQDSAATAKAYTRADGSQVVSLAATDTNAGITGIVTNSGYTCLSLWQQASTAGGVSQYLAAFYNSSTLLGSITHNGSSTAFNTSSDYRLKENLITLSDALTRISALPTYRFNFKSDPSRTVDGCLAHEVAQVVPEAVVGQKDGTAPDGSILPQAVDYSKLVPLLIASVKELSAKVTVLEQQLAALT